MHGYWAARGLAERGHKVFVVTNANEVEPTFRIHLSEEDLSTGGEYARAFPSTSGEVKVYSTEPPDRRQLYYIPINNPTTTRLATIATNLIRAEGCQAIFSYYFEPYGLAAHLASRWTAVPYVLKHAGSDLNRLMALEDLQTAYLEVMKAANRIISRGASRRQLLSYGVSASRINSDVAFGVPTDYFRPDAPPLDINALLLETSGGTTGNEQPAVPLNKKLPILGCYGKLGEWKGSFDLLHAMARLVNDGFKFYLVAMSHGWQEHRFRELVEELGLSDYVRFLPFLPHWKVPGFIRSCTAVAFLERDFPIAAHTPTIPSEVIACGKCLILSAEVARKQFFRADIRSHRNVVVVPDPKQHETLASCLRFALENPQRAEMIGQQALREFGTGHPHESYINDLETLLTEVAAEEPVALGTSHAPEELRSRTDIIDAANDFFPYTSALLDEALQEELREAVAGTALGSGVDDRCELALEIGRTLLSVLDNGSEPGRALVREVCRYEQKTYEWVKKKEAGNGKHHPGIPFSLEHLGSLYPLVEGEAEVVGFSYDVEAICAAMDAGEVIPEAESTVRILFHTGSRPMLINEHTEYLLGLLSGGKRTANEVFKTVASHYKFRGKTAKTRLVESGLSVLEGLYWEGVVGFTATRPGERQETGSHIE